MEKLEKKPLVSIISPCYNEESYIEDFLASVVRQTYENIEFIIIDDGSTDATVSVIHKYKAAFLKKGYSFVYIYQENGGQAAAMNQGLKRFRGQYLMWVDADDILLENNVSKKVAFLEKHREYGMVLCQGEIVDSKNINVKTGDYKRETPSGDDRLFEDLILERNVVYGPGTVMVTREAFEKSIPTRHIYESREGQNWQMMLPLSYFCKCGYIEESLVKCVAHEDSHSRVKRSDCEMLNRINNFSILMKSVINEMDISNSEKRKYLEMTDVKYAKKTISLIAKSSTLRLDEYQDMMNEKLCFLAHTKSLGIKNIFNYMRFKVRKWFACYGGS